LLGRGPALLFGKRVTEGDQLRDEETGIFELIFGGSASYTDGRGRLGGSAIPGWETGLEIVEEGFSLGWDDAAHRAAKLFNQIASAHFIALIGKIDLDQAQTSGQSRHTIRSGAILVHSPTSKRGDAAAKSFISLYMEIRI
jgi:hypothetical protein